MNRWGGLPLKKGKGETHAQEAVFSLLGDTKPTNQQTTQRSLFYKHPDTWEAYQTGNQSRSSNSNTVGLCLTFSGTLL